MEKALFQARLAAESRQAWLLRFEPMRMAFRKLRQTLGFLQLAIFSMMDRKWCDFYP